MTGILGHWCLAGGLLLTYLLNPLHAHWHIAQKQGFSTSSSLQPDPGLDVVVHYRGFGVYSWWYRDDSFPKACTVTGHSCSNLLHHRRTPRSRVSSFRKSFTRWYRWPQPPTGRTGRLTFVWILSSHLSGRVRPASSRDSCRHSSLGHWDTQGRLLTTGRVLLEPYNA